MNGQHIFIFQIPTHMGLESMFPVLSVNNSRTEACWQWRQIRPGFLLTHAPYVREWILHFFDAVKGITAVTMDTGNIERISANPGSWFRCICTIVLSSQFPGIPRCVSWWQSRLCLRLRHRHCWNDSMKPNPSLPAVTW